MINKDLYQSALDLWGFDAQVGMVIEECAELILALRKASRDIARKEDVIDEIADVRIMVEQLTHMMDCHDEVNATYDRKITRLALRIEECKSTALQDEKKGKHENTN